MRVILRPTTLRLVALASGIVLGAIGCGTKVKPPESYLRRYGMVPATESSFLVCSRGGCTETAGVVLRPSDWAKIEGVFQPVATDGVEERLRLAKAIALIETFRRTASGYG